MTSSRGALIVLEGCDRAGKTTQAKKLVDALNQLGRATKLIKFPERSTPIGQIIDRYLQQRMELDDRSVHLLFSANRWELSRYIVEELQEGTNLVVDRYAYSGVAFSSAKQTMSIEWCKKPDEGLPAADIVLFLNISPEQAKLRGCYGEERYEKQLFQQQVLDNFQQLKTSNWNVVDASQSIGTVHEQLLQLTLETITTKLSTPIKKLWNMTI